MIQKRRFGHLSISERRQIYMLRGRQVPVPDIAEQIGRHPPTVYRELRRNAFWDEIDEKLNGYYSVTAQESYRLRRQRLRLFQRQPSLRGFVIEKL